MTTPEEQRKQHYDYHSRRFPMEECAIDECRAMTTVVKTLRGEKVEEAGQRKPEPNSANDFMVAAAGNTIVIMKPAAGPVTRDEALRLAAWLVCMVEVTDVLQNLEDVHQFEDVLEAVRNS